MMKQVVLFTALLAVTFSGTESSEVPKYKSWHDLYSALSKELFVTMSPVVNIPDFRLNLTSNEVLMGELNVTRATVSDITTMTIEGISGDVTPPNAPNGTVHLEVTISWDRLSILGSTEFQMFGAEVSGYLNVTFLDKPLLLMKTTTVWDQTSIPKKTCRHKVDSAEFMNTFPVGFQMTPITEFNQLTMKGVIQHHQFRQVVSKQQEDILGIPLFKMICSKIVPETVLINN